MAAKPMDKKTARNVELWLLLGFPAKMVAKHFGAPLGQVRSLAERMEKERVEARAAWMAKMERRRKLYIEALEQQQAEGSQERG